MMIEPVHLHQLATSNAFRSDRERRGIASASYSLLPLSASTFSYESSRCPPKVPILKARERPRERIIRPSSSRSLDVKYPLLAAS